MEKIIFVKALKTKGEEFGVICKNHEQTGQIRTILDQEHVHIKSHYNGDPVFEDGKLVSIITTRGNWYLAKPEGLTVYDYDQVSYEDWEITNIFTDKIGNALIPNIISVDVNEEKRTTTITWEDLSTTTVKCCDDDVLMQKRELPSLLRSMY